MAITLRRTPQQYTPIYNPIIFRVTSDNTGQPNFKYYVEVFITGISFSGKIFSGTYDANPNDSGSATIDIQRILEDYVKYDFSNITYGFTIAYDTSVYYEVQFGEQYGTGDSFATYTNLSTFEDAYAWNSVFSPYNFITYTYTNYTFGDSQECLTNRPNQLYFYGNEDYSSLHFINNVTSGAVDLTINTYNNSDALINSYTMNNPYELSSTWEEKFIYVNIGSKGINDYFDPVKPIDNTVKYYTIQINNSGQLYRYDRLCNWKAESPINVVWLNRLGGIDNFNFKLSRRKSSSINRDNYQKFLQFGYTEQDRGVTVYNEEITDRYILTSDWITEAESIWIQELIESPSVFIIQGSDAIPMVVKNQSYEIKTYRQDRLFNIELDLEYANKRWAQRS